MPWKRSDGSLPVLRSELWTAPTLMGWNWKQVIRASRLMSSSRRARSSKLRSGRPAGSCGSGRLLTPVRNSDRRATLPNGVEGSTWTNGATVAAGRDSRPWQPLQAAIDARWRPQLVVLLPPPGLRFGTCALVTRQKKFVLSVCGLEPRKLAPPKKSGTGGIGFWKLGGVRAGATAGRIQLSNVTVLLNESIAVSAVVTSLRNENGNWLSWNSRNSQGRPTGRPRVISLVRTWPMALPLGLAGLALAFTN